MNITEKEMLSNNYDMFLRLKMWIEIAKGNGKVLEEAINRSCEAVRQRILKRREV